MRGLTVFLCEYQMSHEVFELVFPASSSILNHNTIGNIVKLKAYFQYWMIFNK